MDARSTATVMLVALLLMVSCGGSSASSPDLVATEAAVQRAAAATLTAEAATAAASVLPSPTGTSIIPSPTLPSPTRTTIIPSPTLRSPSQDVSYMQCGLGILDRLAEWGNGVALAHVKGRDNPNGFCVEFVALQLDDVIQDLAAAHQECPLPEDPALQRETEQMDEALAHYNQATDPFWEYSTQPYLLSSEAMAFLARGVEEEGEGDDHLDQLLEEMNQ